MGEKPFEPLAFPAWLRWGRRRGAIAPHRAGRGQTGRRLCAWCETEVPKGRHSWCSDKCVNLYRRVWTWQAVARYVLERDGGRCTRCACDVSALERVGVARTRPWNVDHIRRVVDGGTDDPANLRLLCHACHVAVGYEQRAAKRGSA